MSERELCAPCGGFHRDPGSPPACVSYLRKSLDESFRHNHPSSWRYGGKHRRETLVDDLMLVVKDQRNHIANLEAQLLPHLTGPQPEQDSLL